ncbi:hypothetical protein ACFL1G_07480 [Planctomycetota bacterium]
MITKSVKLLSATVILCCLVIVNLSLADVFAVSGSKPAPRNELIEHGPWILIPGPNPLIKVGKEGSWDDRILEASNFIKDGDTYYFYYHAQGQRPDQQGYRIGVATAPRPLGPFKRYGNKPIVDLGPDGSWDSGSVACAAILKEKADTFYMWYWASRGGGHTGLAYASSPLGPWKKYEGNPVLKDFGYVGGVVKVNGKYHMYNTYPLNSTSPDQGPICLATAEKPEGPWKKYAGNPVVPAGEWGAWDDGGYSEAGMLYHEGVFHTFYAGVKWKKLESIGYAYSFDGINFIKYGGNPVAPREHNPDAAAFAEVHGFWESPLFYVYHTIRYTSRGTMDRTRGGEELGVQIIATRTPFSLAMPVLSVDSLSAGGSTKLSDCPPICLESISEFALNVECNYDTNAKAGLRVLVFASWDGLKYDTEPLYSFDIRSAGGQRVSKTVPLDAKVMFIKVIVENPDKANDVDDVQVTATLGHK